MGAGDGDGDGGGGHHYYYYHPLPITFSTGSMKIETTPLGAKNLSKNILWGKTKSCKVEQGSM
jgi:hypothetical protein